MKQQEVITIGESLVAFIPDSNTRLRYVQRFGKAVVGAESNVAVGLSKLGHTAAWISKVGADEFGQYMIREIRAEGVDTSRVVICDTAPTAVMFKQFSSAGTSVFYYRSGSAASTLKPGDMDWEFLGHAKILHLSGITPALSPSCAKLVQEVFAFAKQQGIQISFDPNIRRKLWNERQAKDALIPLVEQSDIVLLGEEKGLALLGTADRKEIARRLADKGVRRIGVKRGSAGSYVADANGGIDIPPYPVDVVDTVGAGDAFDAGFLAGLLEESSIERCGKMGNLMGAMAVRSSGDTDGLPDRDEFDRLMDDIQEVQR